MCLTTTTSSDSALEVVDTDGIVSFRELHAEFAKYVGRKWKDTPRQIHALHDEWIKIVAGRLKGKKAEEGDFTRWLGERKGFSVKYGSFGNWREQSSRSSAYQRRVEGYLLRHPHATLAGARGHRRK